mmetsp:Transcript_1240/g.3728  ORF Transcript_1240/g.3728 Transcript_1240/m.3728 type:complete len:229 (-) Transcript_1240:1352-2038(-)
MSCPKSAAKRSPTEAFPSSAPSRAAGESSSSHACHLRMTSWRRWSAERAFCCRTRTSSLANDSLSSCQYSLRTASSPTAFSSHVSFSACRCCRKKVRSASSDIGKTTPPSRRCPAASARRTIVPCARSSSASCPQEPCCTASQAPLTLRLLLAFKASTSCRKRAAKDRHPMGSPPTVFGFAWHAVTMRARKASTPERNSLLKEEYGKLSSSRSSASSVAGCTSVAQLL